MQRFRPWRLTARTSSREHFPPAKVLGLSYANAAPSAMIGASNHFEVAIATAVMLFGLSSGAALATVVGVLIEVPLMLALVRFCERTSGWFPQTDETSEATT